MPVFSLRVFCVAAMCLLSSGQRVFFKCGAKLDVADAQGLVLSPGFPLNYSSGSHCVWQFFVPISHQLTMEVFDFDVFESSQRNSSSGSIKSEGGEDHLLTAGLIRSQTVLQEHAGNPGEAPWNLTWRDSEMVHGTTTEDDSDALPPLKETCPGDVLYITDLSSFSSRFCGAMRPSDQLVFGSKAKPLEVIMELITNTHRGRGFALMFRYCNRTSGADSEVGAQSSSVPSVGTVEALLAAMSLAALFATSLMIVLCVTQRLKLCVKKSNMTSSISLEVPVQNLYTDHPEQELNKNYNPTLTYTGNIPECQGFQNAMLECSTGLTEMELGADEVFMISNPKTPSFFPCTHSDHILQCSDTGSLQPSDWMPRSEPPNWRSRGGHVGSPRPRVWSVRTFQDFLLPFPQLNRKWCSWNLTSHFTKLVDMVSPSSVVDAGDAAKVPSAQHQRRSQSQASQQLGGPNGPLCGPEQEVEVTICKFTTSDEDLSIPVFAISEEDDREPLVSAERLQQAKHGAIRNHESYASLGSTHSALMDGKSAVTPDRLTPDRLE